MLDRIKKTPFNQDCRGLLKYYNETSFFDLDKTFSTPVIIL